MLDHTAFVFDGYSWDLAERRVTLRYTLEGGSSPVQFEEIVDLPLSMGIDPHLDPQALDRALFALHLIGGISYFKTCCPKTIIVRSGTLTPEQADFWREVYENGLGEFFYRNNIDFRGLVIFPSQKNVVARKPKRKPVGSKRGTMAPHVIVPIGGGKDSVVTLELLKQADMRPLLFRMGKHPIIDELATIAGLPLLTVERTLSSALFELNAQGALNGHVPITAYLSFLSVVVALLTGSRTVVMSNEASANVGSLMFYGKEINHQWSKSLAFEEMFQNYVRSSIHPDIQHFSLLRPLSELGVVKIFSLLPAYIPFATSCNANWRITQERRAAKRWCGTCPKCASVFCLLAAFLPKTTVEELFGKNLYADESLLPTYRELLGSDGTKPFECVGTPEETQAAFLLARERKAFNDTPAMQMFLRDSLPGIKDADTLIRNVLTPKPQHCIPPTFSTLVPNPATLP